MTAFSRHAIFLFLALRAGDLVNLAAGMWLVPKFIAPEELGAVLPVTTFATLLVLPIFAFGMTVMKESADLAGHNARGQLKSLWRGVFVAIGILAIVSLFATAALLPRYLKAMRVADATGGFFVLAAALLGSVAPVYADALQAIKRFHSLGAIEFSAAIARFATLAIAMPFRAFTGYFAGNAVQPLIRIAASIFVLRHDLAICAERWWTHENTKRLLIRFGLVLLYLTIPMAVSSFEQSLVRETLPTEDSAAYYIVTRLSDLMNYLTFPLLIVLFPYAAEAERNGKHTLPLVVRASAVTLAAAFLLGVVYAQWGKPLLALIPNGANYSTYLVYTPMLLAITAMTASQTFYTNAEVAAGRFTFLWWFAPMNAVYTTALKLKIGNGGLRMKDVLFLFLAGAALRFVCAAIAAFAGCRQRRILPEDVRGKGSVRTTTTEMRL